MPYLFERIIIWIWNAWIRRARGKTYPGDLILGTEIRPGRFLRTPYVLRRKDRPEHITVLGKTGTGKTSLLQTFCEQDIRAGHGFVFFDLHGQVTPALLARIALEEKRRGRDLSDRFVLIDPANPSWSVGSNVLGGERSQRRYVRIIELVEVLRARWRLDSFGARTEELLRNGLLVLMDCGLTLLELEPLLSDTDFRRQCLVATETPSARSYFEKRFDPLSAPFRAVIAEPVLNKITAFSNDPHVRHIIGQAVSTLSWSDILEDNRWVVVNLDKGRLGEQSLTLGSLLLTQLKSSLFGRKSTKVFSLYCDEIQNLVAYDLGLQNLFAEARKFGVSVCSANQYLEQLGTPMRAAVLSAGTQVLFQLSGSDASHIAYQLGSANTLAETLRTLPKRQFMVRAGSATPVQVEAAVLHPAQAETKSLYHRIARRWGRRRDQIEQEIQTRRMVYPGGKEFNDWE